MTPDSPPPSDGSALPPRHRPNLGNLAKESTEVDLWTFEELDPDASSPPAPAPIDPRPTPSSIPARRSTERVRSARGEAGPARPFNPEVIRTNVGKSNPNRPSGSPSAPIPTNELSELGSWGDLDDAEFPAPVLAPVTPMPVPQPKSTFARPVVEATDDGPPPDVDPSEPAPPSAASEADVVDEFSIPKPVSRGMGLPKLQWNLSAAEKIGVATMALVLLVAAALTHHFTLHRLPIVSQYAKTQEYPVTGKYVTLAAGSTYWRSPVTDGANPDPVQGGTVLIPEVDFKGGGNSGAIRVFFRNADGAVVGDAVTRTIKPGESVRIAATAGFEDRGMHAAYKIGTGKRWTIQVLEAPTPEAPVAAFKELLKLDVSVDVR